MPTYEYCCEKCKKSFDVFQSMKDAALEICPEDLCRMEEWGRGRVTRQIGTGAGLLFKGSGFYITDYRSEGYKQAAKKDSPTSSDASTSSKSDTKNKGTTGGAESKKTKD